MSQYREAPQQPPFYINPTKKAKSPGKTYEQLVAEEEAEKLKQNKPKDGASTHIH